MSWSVHRGVVEGALSSGAAAGSKRLLVLENEDSISPKHLEALRSDTASYSGRRVSSVFW